VGVAYSHAANLYVRGRLCADRSCQIIIDIYCLVLYTCDQQGYFKEFEMGEGIDKSFN